MGDLTVRAAREEDLAALLTIERTASHDPWGERAILSQLASPVGLSLVCEENGRVLGSLYLSLCAPESEVLALAVLPSARRRGIGRLLLENGMILLKSGGACVLYLDVRESNAPARALYSSLGFRENGQRRGFYSAPKEDAVLMERELTDAVSRN